MTDKNYHLYGYRWVVLAVFMFINLTIEILWICYAPITKPAAAFYHVSDSQIGFLSEIWFIAFIPLSFPVSWAIDTFGFYRAVGVGAILMAVFGILRGFAGSYSLVLWCTIGLGIAQPFLLNAWTKVPAQWFGLEERATAVGLITLSNLLGTAIGEALPPILLQSGISIQTQQLIFGSITAFSSLLFLVLTREKPATPPCPPGHEARALMLDGLKNALAVKDFWLLLFVAFAGLGIFNGIETWVENIISPRGFTPTDAGTFGALMVIGGIIGAVVLPPFSDKQQKQIRYLLIGFLLAIPGLIGITYATNFWLLILFRILVRLLSHRHRPHSFSICSRDYHPHARRNFKRDDSTNWPGLRDIRLHHGCHGKFKRRIYFIAVAGSGDDYYQPHSHYANEGPGVLENLIVKN